MVSPTTHQEGVAPLISALIERIASLAYELDAQSALPHRFLLSLDEVCKHRAPAVAPGGATRCLSYDRTYVRLGVVAPFAIDRILEVCPLGQELGLGRSDSILQFAQLCAQ